jgi:hypothetical protein
MIVLKFLAGVVILAVLTGCPDYEKKALVQKVLKIQPPCPPPGTPTNIECHYRLTIKSVSGNTARGGIPMDAIKVNQEGCEHLKAEKKFPPDHICPNANDYPDNEYEFDVDPSTPVQQGQTLNFINILRTKMLRVQTQPS